MSQSWDVIVLGLGGVGSAAAYHLASAGAKVLGIDQFPPAHNLGSSHGDKRVIRQAYFEHPDYVPLLQRSYKLWDQLEQVMEQRLFHHTGVVQIGPADGVVVPGVLRSAQQHDLDVESLPMSDVIRQWPGLRGESDWQAVIERNAGYLRVEACVDAHLQLAKRAGAVCRHGETVRSWQSGGSGAAVTTDAGLYHADRLVIAAGAWSGEVLKAYDVPLRVLRKYQYWFGSANNTYNEATGFPCFFFETPTGYYYGFPDSDERGVKLARHSGGRQWERPLVNPCDGPAGDKDAEDLALTQAFSRGHLPALNQVPIRQSGCYYTKTPDENFIVDRLPDQPAVTVVAGLSGHGFKFTSVLGEIAARITFDQASETKLFSISRWQ